jgi:hypothetical protein
VIDVVRMLVGLALSIIAGTMLGVGLSDEPPLIFPAVMLVIVAIGIIVLPDKRPPA